MKKTRQQELQPERDYVAFLKKRLASEHFRANATQEEQEKTKAKYDKAKLRLRLLEGPQR